MVIIVVHDVFISYSAKNKVIADAVTAKLESKRIRTWIAPRDILPSDDWGESIINAIEKSKIFIIILTEDSNQSSQVIREVERAVNMGIPIIPFRVEDVELSKSLQYFLSTTHWLDALTPPLEKHIDKLVEIVQTLKYTIEGKDAEIGKEETEDLINKYLPNYKPKKDYNIFIRIFGLILSIIVVISIIYNVKLNNMSLSNPLNLILTILLLLVVLLPGYINELLKNWLNFKKLFTLISIALMLLILLVPIISYSPYQETSKFSYSGNGIYMELPNTFYSDSYPDYGTLAAFFSEEYVNEKKLTYNLTIYKESYNSTLDSYYLQQIASMKQANYSNITGKNTTLDGYNATDITYLKVDQNTTKFREVWIKKEGYIYRIVLNGPEEDFNNYNNIFENILQTFKFN